MFSTAGKEEKALCEAAKETEPWRVPAPGGSSNQLPHLPQYSLHTFWNILRSSPFQQPGLPTANLSWPSNLRCDKSFLTVHRSPPPSCLFYLFSLALSPGNTAFSNTAAIVRPGQHEAKWRGPPRRGGMYPSEATGIRSLFCPPHRLELQSKPLHSPPCYHPTPSIPFILLAWLAGHHIVPVLISPC